MQLIQKHIIILSGCIVFILFGYFAFQDFNSSQSDEVKINTRTISSMTQSAIETDTGKRLEIVANSGTQWGMSPFGSGKPLEEEKKLEFKKPNTEWKTRTLSGITYVFGEGNPAGVATLSDKEKEIYANCYLHPELTQATCDSKTGPEALGGYLNPDVEKDLLTLLSHPAWSLVLTNCESDFRAYETTDGFMPIMDGQFTYDRVMNGGFLDIERYYYIAPESGRKLIEIYPLQHWFGNVLRYKQTVNSAQDVLNIANCITQNGGMELYRLMNIIHQKQLRPLGNYPDRITDPKQYMPWY